MVQDQEIVYPVNAVAFHEEFGTFATGGSDACVSVWDPVKKKKIRQLQFPNAVSSIAFSRDGR